MIDWLALADQLLGPIDEIVGDWVGEAVETAGDLLFDEGAGDAGILPGGIIPSVGGGSPDPGEHKVGFKRQGWVVGKVTHSVLEGRRTVLKKKNAWKKTGPKDGQYNNMNFVERAGYFLGKRVQAYDSRKAKNAAYKRGFNNGARAQQKAEKTQESGGTPLVQYVGRR